MRWLVTGAGGTLGSDLCEILAEDGRAVTAAPRSDLDITDESAVRDAVAGHDVVVNCAAWTDVDGAEAREGEAFAVNALGPAALARACARAAALLVHVSTDYVFNGGADRLPFGEDAGPAPLSAYARGKLAGEWAVRAVPGCRAHVVRTAWLYGVRGPSFVRTMLCLERERDHVDVVCDRYGQPTCAAELARRIVDLVDADPEPGVWHGAALGVASWYDLARAVFAAAGADPARVRPLPAAALSQPAARPVSSVLRQDGWARAGLPPMRHWRDALPATVSRIRAGGG